MSILSANATEPFPKQQIFDSSKMKEFADDNSKFDENGRKFSKWVENNMGKDLNCRGVTPRACLGKGYTKK